MDEYNRLMELASDKDSRRFNEIERQVDKEDLWDIRCGDVTLRIVVYTV